MTISDLKTIIQNQLDGLPVKAIFASDGSTPTSTSELFIPAPLPGYAGIGEIEDGPKFVWRLSEEGKGDWVFNSNPM